jgi:hypothetical protein
MSIQLVCDVCGKNSGRDQAIFSNGLELICTNHKDEDYRVVLNIGLQHVDDAQFFKAMETKTEDEIIELTGDDSLTIKNPDPHVCLACQRGLVYQLLREGKVDSDTVYKVEQKVKVKAVDQFGDPMFFDDEEYYEDEDEE